MTDKIFIAGAGGQGVIALGKLIAEAACLEGRHVTYYPSYGAEIRGGTANCSVIVSDLEIGSPTINKATTMLIMNSPSYKKFAGKIEKGGIMIVNSSLVHPEQSVKNNFKVISIPATEMAQELGDVRCANILMLGLYIAAVSTLNVSNVRQALQSVFEKKKDLIELNVKALEAGMNAFSEGINE